MKTILLLLATLMFTVVPSTASALDINTAISTPEKAHANCSVFYGLAAVIGSQPESTKEILYKFSARHKAKTIHKAYTEALELHTVESNMDSNKYIKKYFNVFKSICPAVMSGR